MSIKKFTIDEVTYKAKELDFNMICELEDIGIQLSDMKNKKMSAIRGYFSVVAELDVSVAGKIIEKHLMAGGSLDELVEAFSWSIEESDFFQALSQTTEKKAEKKTAK